MAKVLADRQGGGTLVHAVEVQTGRTASAQLLTQIRHDL
jgi:hypothetical protein